MTIKCIQHTAINANNFLSWQKHIHGKKKIKKNIWTSCAMIDWYLFKYKNNKNQIT